MFVRCALYLGGRSGSKLVRPGTGCPTCDSVTPDAVIGGKVVFVSAPCRLYESGQLIASVDGRMDTMLSLVGEVQAYK